MIKCSADLDNHILSTLQTLSNLFINMSLCFAFLFRPLFVLDKCVKLKLATPIRDTEEKETQ